MSITLPMVIGTIIGNRYNAWAGRTANPERAKRYGTLAASGLSVGESIFGVIHAGLIVGLANDAPLALVPGDFRAGEPIALISFAALLVLLYGWLGKQKTGRTAP
jgi:hypothetical protein